MADDECTPEMLAMLNRQRAYFASDQLLIDRARPWRDATPEECLVATMESCSEVDWMFSMMEPDVRERALRPDPIPASVLAILQAMQKP